MAKAIKLYSGTDTYGRHIEVAERTDGVWFWRDYGYNGYGMAWGKWGKLDHTPSHPAKVRNMIEIGEGPEYVDIPEDSRVYRIEWGWNVLRLCPGPHRIRLPN